MVIGQNTFLFLFDQNDLIDNNSNNKLTFIFGNASESVTPNCHNPIYIDYTSNNIDFNCLFSERLTYCKKLESTCNQLQKKIDDEIKIRQEGNAEFFELVKRTENKRVETSEFLESVEQYELN